MNYPDQPTTKKMSLPWTTPRPAAPQDHLSDNDVLLTTCRTKALMWLSRREYSAHELVERLVLLAPRALAKQTVQSLQEEGLQSDQRYVEAKVQALSRKFGWQRIKRDLQQAGIDPTLISLFQPTIDTSVDESELDRAYSVLIKKCSHPPQDIKARTSLIRFMQGRGFSWEIISKALAKQKAMVLSGDIE